MKVEKDITLHTFYTLTVHVYVIVNNGTQVHHAYNRHA